MDMSWGEKEIVFQDVNICKYNCSIFVKKKKEDLIKLNRNGI